MTVSPLFFVRHGRTEWNVSGRFQGQRNIPLSRKGRMDASQLAEKLRESIRLYPDRTHALDIICSPLGRARQTADVIAEILGSNHALIEEDDRIAELSFGHWEGLTTAEIKLKHNDERRARKADRWNVAPEGGHSYSERCADVDSFLTDIPAPAIIVSHGGVLRIVHHLLGGVPADLAAKMDIPHDNILIYESGILSWRQEKENHGD